MQESFRWWQSSGRYIISLSPLLHTPFSLSLISLMVSVHHVYFLTCFSSSTCLLMDQLILFAQEWKETLLVCQAQRKILLMYFFVCLLMDRLILFAQEWKEKLLECEAQFAEENKYGLLDMTIPAKQEKKQDAMESLGGTFRKLNVDWRQHLSPRICSICCFQPVTWSGLLTTEG